MTRSLSPFPRSPAFPRGALSALVLGVATLAGAPSASAAPPPAPLARSLQGTAREAYEASKLLLANSDFRGALLKLEQAYELSKDPRLLYNMALCHRNLHAYAKMEMLLAQYERDAADTMTPAERAAVDSALAATASLVGELKVTVTPPGATVAVDGQPVGTTPFKDPVLVDLGSHVVRASKDGFDAVERSVDAKGGGVSEVTFALTAVGTLTVSADPAAVVSIDGNVVDRTRPRVQVPVGAHAVRVSEAGKVPYVTEVSVRGGENRTVEVTLTDEKHLPLWPFIVGGAAVVAAGAALGGYFLLDPSTTVTPPPLGKLGNAQFQSVRFR